MDQPALHAYIAHLERCLTALGRRPEPALIERWALLIYRAMGARTRVFHRPNHPLDLVEDGDPVAGLAALFHDVVYVQVDRGLPPHLGDALGRYASLKDGVYRLSEAAAAPGDPALPAAGLFGLKPGDALSPFTGLNEYLSAVVAALELGGTLAPAELLEVLCCIEATIPFRGLDKEGASPFDRLASRLAALDASGGLGMGEARRLKAVQRAALVAGRDVANFGWDDPARFLDNTWMLLPETNPALHDPDLYTVKEYRTALQKMEGFLGTLQAERVFYQYHGAPDDAAHRARLGAAARNIGLAGRYLRAKLIAAALLEVIAEASGGDAPISLFMGQLPGQDGARPRLEVLLPAAPAASDADLLLLRLLEEGRASETSFDMRRAPLAAFVYRHLGERGLSAAHAAAKRLFAGEGAAKDFLAALPRAMVADIARAMGRMASTRRGLIEKSLPELLPA